MAANSTPAPRYLSLLLSFALFCALLRGWIMPLGSSFYLDETGSYYLVSGSWNEYLTRMSLTIQSPLYMTFLWLWARVVGLSEIALRIPSLIAAGLASYFLYRLGKKLVDSSAGLAAASVLFSTGMIIQQTFQARPYAFCMLGSVLAMKYLFDWLESRRWPEALLSAAALTALLYLQPLNVSMMAVATVVVALYHLHRQPIPWQQATAVLALPVTLLLPVLPYYRSAASDAATYVYTKPPALDQFVNLYADVVSAGALLFGLLLAALFFRDFRFAAFDLHPFAAKLTLVWAVLPPLLIFLYSRAAWPVFLLRYYAVAFPAFALLLGCMLRLAAPSGARIFALAMFSLTSTAAVWSTSFWPDTSEWRGAAELLRQRGYAPDTPVLVNSGFTEGKNINRLKNPGTQEFLNAPAYAYPVPGRLYTMPYHPNVGGGDYWRSILAKTVDRHPRVMLWSADPLWHAWFLKQYGDRRKVERLHSLVTEIGAPVQGTAGGTQ